MTSIVRHFKVQKDGSLKLVGNETVKIEEGKKKLTLDNVPKLGMA